jgi:hypothetical protein
MTKQMIELKYYNEKYYILNSTIEAKTTKYTKYKICVSAGLWTDGASIPKILWSFIGSPLTGRYVRGAIVHDALYSAQPISRKECDLVLLELMEQDNVPRWKRLSMYYAVKLFGWSHWNKRNNDTKKKNKVQTFVNIVKDK